ncbi:MAG: hypothetical protein WC058_02095 [Phycisphaeraceae bacterium]
MNLRIPLFVIAAMFFAASSALAVKPGQWTQDTEAAFGSASLDQTIVTNLGRIELARASDKLAELKDDATIIYDMARLSDGQTFLAVGPAGELASLDKDNKIASVVKYENAQVFALAVEGDVLWVAVSGDKTSRLEKREAGKATQTLNLPDVRYIWDVLVSDGKLYLATGTDGKVLQVDPAAAAAPASDERPPEAMSDEKAEASDERRAMSDERIASSQQPTANSQQQSAISNSPTPGTSSSETRNPKPETSSPAYKPVVVLDCEQNNVLCLGIDAQKRLYAGTDTEGLVYRITPQPDNTPGSTEHPFSAYVIYDAGEPEIGAMIVMPDGTVYVGTADADQAKPGRLNEPSKEEQGKPTSAPGSGKPGEKPTPSPIPIPTPPEKPEPPVQPQPQPQPQPAPAPGSGSASDNRPPEASSDEKAAVSSPQIKNQKSEISNSSAQSLSLQMTQAAVSFAEGDAPSINPAAPTKAQYDKLRQLIGQRLTEARKTGSLASGKDAASRGVPAPGSLGPRRAGASAKSNAPTKPGNAVYCISPDGFVRECFRESVMILRIEMVAGQIIIATGNEGQIYRVDPSGQPVTVLADLDAQQIPAMLVHDGQILIGTANPGQIVRLTAGFAHTGSFTADPLDAAQISRWGNLQLLADLPEHTGVTVSTRSGNLADPDNGFWSEWSAPITVAVPAEGQPFFLEIPSPSARFIQYKLTLTSDGSASPAVSLVALKYLMPNLAPRVNALRAKYPDLQIKPDAPPSPRNTLNIDWEAADPNGDTLAYTLEVRKLGSDQPFVKIAADLKDANFNWNTLTMPDGRYELRVTASDAPDNVPDETQSSQRLSAPVVIDNTAPTITDLAATRRGQLIGPAVPVVLSAQITDAMSIIADIRYSLSVDDQSDAAPAWNAVLPVDQIDDSTNESVSFTIPPLAPGVRVLTLRATDAQGNTAYQSITVTTPRP